MKFKLDTNYSKVECQFLFRHNCEVLSEIKFPKTNFLEYDEIHMNLVENKQENETESEQERMLRLCQEAFADLEEPEEKQEIDEISEEIENNISEQFDEMIE